MGDRITIAGAAVGAAGAAYRRLLTYAAKAAGNYPITEANFAGVGQYLPCGAIIALTPGAGGAAIQVTSDGGTTWHALATGTAPLGQFVYLDSAGTYRIVITTNPTDVRIFIQ